jgi:hypothetical protein
MRWDDRLTGHFDGLFDDLEQQAEGLALGARDAEVAEQRRWEYAQVDLASRLFSSVGARLLVSVTGVGAVDATLRRVGDGWCLLDAGRQEWIVPLAAVGSLRGLADRGVADRARPVTARLGLASALRGVAESRAEAVLHGLDGALLRGVLGRVGADFVEVRAGESGGVEVVPFGALAAVRTT